MGHDFERSIAALSGYAVILRNELRPRQRISAQSQPRFCTPIFRPGLPCPQEGGPSPQVPLSALQRLEVAQIVISRFEGRLAIVACPRHLASLRPPLLLPTPLTQGQPNPLQDDIMDFAPLAKGCLPQALIQRLGQVEAGVNDSRPPLTALGLCWCARGAGLSFGALPFKPLLRASQGFLRPVLSRIRAGPPTKPL
jgi:hypothetical protein